MNTFLLKYFYDKDEPKGCRIAVECCEDFIVPKGPSPYVIKVITKDDYDVLKEKLRMAMKLVDYFSITRNPNIYTAIGIATDIRAENLSAEDENEMP